MSQNQQPQQQQLWESLDLWLYRRMLKQWNYHNSNTAELFRQQYTCLNSKTYIDARETNLLTIRRTDGDKNKDRIYPQVLRRPGTYILATLKIFKSDFS